LTIAKEANVEQQTSEKAEQRISVLFDPEDHFLIPPS
jgi:hypothetical protein